MNDARIFRTAGFCGLGAILLVFCELPLWAFPGAPPPLADAAGFSDYLAGIRVVALVRILLDMGIYVCLMVFFAGFRRLVVASDERCEWLGTLAFGAGAVWWSAILVANALQGGAVLHTVGGDVDPTAVRTLVEGTLLLFNGPVMFATAGLFMASAGAAILASGALPRPVGHIAWGCAGLCALALPAVLVDVVDTEHVYNAAGWGPGLVAAGVPIVWFGAAGFAMIRRARKDAEPAT